MDPPVLQKYRLLPGRWRASVDQLWDPQGVCVWADVFENKEKVIFQTYSSDPDLQED